jgi:hypothetical protein
MIRDCGVNRLNQFATFLAQHLRNSRQNPRLLALLQTLDDALYSGLALPREEEEWAHGNGIRLRVSWCLFSMNFCLISTRISLAARNVEPCFCQRGVLKCSFNLFMGCRTPFSRLLRNLKQGPHKRNTPLPHLCSNLSSSRSHRTARIAPCGALMDTSILVIYSRRLTSAIIYPRAGMMIG